MRLLLLTLLFFAVAPHMAFAQQTLTTAEKTLLDKNLDGVVRGFIWGIPKTVILEEETATFVGAEDTAEAKMRIMAECGIHVVASPADIGATMAKALQGAKVMG